MNKFPLDKVGLEALTSNILKHSEAQASLVKTLASYLRNALHWIGPVEDFENNEWVEKANVLLEKLKNRDFDFENLRFNQSNGHNLTDISPYTGEGSEEGFGETMTEEELAKLFNEPLVKKEKKKAVHKMTLDEIHSWEKEQDNSNDIFKISARVNNLARQGAGANLTSVGEMLTNTYVHVLKSFYDFAETVQDPEIKIKLIELTRSHEGMPGTFIAATTANVKNQSK